MLFGRVMFIALAILMQVAFLVLIVLYLDTNSYVAFVVSMIFAFIAVLHLINRDMSPEGKVTWVIVLLVVPIAGVLLYIMFSQNRISRHQQKLLRKIYDESIEHLASPPSSFETYRDSLGVYYGQGKYLSSFPTTTIHDNTETLYFSDGREFWLDLLEQLKRAEKFIFLEYFIIERGVMWDAILEVLEEKVKAGVEVRVMYDDIGCISKLPANYYRKLREKGIDCVKFNRFVPIASAVHNNRDHRKITVIDGNVGYIGGINLADEYINEITVYGHWKDTAVRLRGDAVRSLTIMFLQLFNMQAKRTEDYNQYMPTAGLRYPNSRGYVIPFGDGPRPLYQEQIGEQAYLNIIDNAKKYVYITTPYLIIDDRLRQSLRSAAKRGVDVRIITPNIPDKKLVFTITRYNYKPLQEAGVKIYQYTNGFIHAKSILSDDLVAIVGTINLDYRSLVHHYECGVWMYQTDANLQLKNDFNFILQASTLQGKHVLNIWQRMFCKIAMIFSPLM